MKTLAISEEVHFLIAKKQLEIREKYKIHIKISDIANFILKNNIDQIEDILRDNMGTIDRHVENGNEKILI